MTDKTMTLDQQMQAVAERIAASCHPDDARLEIAYAIARNLSLDGWPCAHLSQTAERGEAVAAADEAAAQAPNDSIVVAQWQTIRARLVELEAENERLRGMLRDGVQE